MKIDPIDKLVSQIAKLRAGNKCEYCGEAYKKRETSHFHGRRKVSVRYDLDNVAWLCFTCHQEMHSHPDLHSEWFEKRLGSEKYEQLGIRSRMLAREIKLDKVKIKKNLTGYLEAFNEHKETLKECKK